MKIFEIFLKIFGFTCTFVIWKFAFILNILAVFSFKLVWTRAFIIRFHVEALSAIQTRWDWAKSHWYLKNSFKNFDFSLFSRKWSFFWRNWHIHDISELIVSWNIAGLISLLNQNWKISKFCQILCQKFCEFFKY